MNFTNIHTNIHTNIYTLTYNYDENRRNVSNKNAPIFNRDVESYLQVS